MAEIKDCILNYSDFSSYVDIMNRGVANLPPLIISVAITGGNQGKEVNPNLPETPEEQVQQTYDAYKAGASIVHIHRRRDDNPSVNTFDTDAFLKINAMVREKCPDLIINNTAAGGRVRFNDDDTVSDLTISSIYAKPEIASFDTSNYIARDTLKTRKPPLFGRDEDVTFDFSYSMTPSEAEKVATIMKENGAKPEFEIFDTGDLHYLYDLIKGGFVDKPYWIQLLVHPQFNFPTPHYFLTMLGYTPPGSLVSVIGIGRSQFPILTLALCMGCHVRVGMEDNIYIGKGQLAESNAQFVEKIVRLARELGREIATPKQARQMLGISETPRQYK